MIFLAEGDWRYGSLWYSRIVEPAKFGDNLAKISPSSNGFRESVQKAKLEAQKAKELEEKERDRIEKDWRLHHPIQATLRDWRKGLSDGLDSMTNWMKDDPNWKWLKGFGDAAFGAVGDAVFGVAEFGVDLLQYSTEGVILGYNSLMGNETPQWMKDDLQGGIETFGDVFLNTLGNAFGLVTMIPEVNNLINDLDNSTRDGSIIGAILHDVRHAKDLKQQPIRDKINLVGKFSGYDSGYAAGEIVSEIVSWIGPAKLAKMAGGSKLVSRLAQMPKIRRGYLIIKKLALCWLIVIWVCWLEKVMARPRTSLLVDLAIYGMTLAARSSPLQA